MNSKIKKRDNMDESIEDKVKSHVLKNYNHKLK